MSNLIKRSFPYLEDFLNKYNFKDIEEKRNLENFGNVVSVFGNDVLYLRFVKDRSQFFIDIKLPSEKTWHQFYIVLEFLGLDKTTHLDIEKQIFELGNQYENICNIFNDIKQKGEGKGRILTRTTKNKFSKYWDRLLNWS